VGARGKPIRRRDDRPDTVASQAFEPSSAVSLRKNSDHVAQ